MRRKTVAQMLLLAGISGVLIYSVLLVFVRSTANFRAALLGVALVALASGGVLYLLSSARPNL